MKKQLEFFNTINLGGYELNESIKHVKRQDERVLEIMKQVNEPMTPLQVSRVYNELYSPAPHTSIRRAINTLTNRGLLRQLNKQRVEQFGAKNYFWEFKK